MEIETATATATDLKAPTGSGNPDEVRTARSEATEDRSESREPHNWASAEFVRLTRNLLIFERGDRLELLPGLPEKWLPTSANPLVLAATSTKFGPVDLRLERTEENYRLSYSRASRNQAPDEVLLHWDGVVAEDGFEQVDETTWRLSDESAAETTLSR